VDFSETRLLEMEESVERTGSEIKIIPTEFSKLQEYVRLLNLFEKKQGIQLEKLLYPFNSKGDFQREIIEYYRKMEKMINEMEFLFDFVSENSWFDEQNISNLKEMMKVIENEPSRKSNDIHHFIQNGYARLPETKEKEIT